MALRCAIGVVGGANGHWAWAETRFAHNSGEADQKPQPSRQGEFPGDGFHSGSIQVVGLSGIVLKKSRIK